MPRIREGDLLWKWSELRHAVHVGSASTELALLRNGVDGISDFSLFLFSEGRDVEVERDVTLAVCGLDQERPSLHLHIF